MTNTELPLRLLLNFFALHLFGIRRLQVCGVFLMRWLARYARAAVAAQVTFLLVTLRTVDWYA